MDTSARPKPSRRTVLLGGAAALGALAVSAGYAWPRPEARLNDPEPRAVKGPEISTRGDVQALAFSPDGRVLATGNGHVAVGDRADGKGIELWNAVTGEHLATWEDTNAVKSLAFGPDGTSLLSGGYGGVRLWETATGENTATLAEDPVYSVAFSRDGIHVAAGHYASGVRLWDVTTGRKPATLASDKAEQVTFNADGTLLAARTVGASVWDVQSMRLIARLPEVTGRRICFAGAGDRIAALSRHPSRREFGVGVWDVRTGKLADWIPGTGHKDDLAFGPDGTLMALTGFGQESGFSLWSVAGRRLIQQPDVTPCFRGVFSPDGTAIAVGAGSGDRLTDGAKKVQLWQLG